MTRPLADFIDRAQRLFVLTGAGCSTDSGIPDYRDADGQWKRTPPVTYQAFMGELATRQRYWARSLLGWPRFGHARPNGTHAALAALEARGQLEVLLTQNVDRLHQRAGSRAVIDLHGRLDQVRCMGCEARTPREAFQQVLLAHNPAGTSSTRPWPRTATPTWTGWTSARSRYRHARNVAASSSRMWSSSAKMSPASGWLPSTRTSPRPMPCWWWAPR